MQRREIATLFRERLAFLITRSGGGLAGFARASGVDRSALSQFLAADAVRLPRAETLRAIAESNGVTTDWLLGLSNADDGGQALATSVEIETAFGADGRSTFESWLREAAGAKIRAVPALLPDMMLLPEVMAHTMEAPRAQARHEHGAHMLDDARLGETDIEIAMPLQRLVAFEAGIGLWSGLPRGLRIAQLERMASLTEAHYPRLRLHLYDGRRTFSAPYTTFGAVRAALYLGRSYLVLSSAEQVRALMRHFDGLVRESVQGSERAHLAVRAVTDGETALLSALIER